MKTLKINILEINGIVEVDVKAIGNLQNEKQGSLCLVSEKNLVNVLKAFGTVPASQLAQTIAKRLNNHSADNDFNSKMLQEILLEELDYVQFAVDCGELILGDDSSIKEFLGEKKFNQSV